MTGKSRIDSSHSKRCRIRTDELAFRRSFGKKLLECRGELSISYRQLSEASSVSHSAIALYEKGRSSPDSDALIRLMSSLKFNLADLGIVVQISEGPRKSSHSKTSLSEITKERFTEVFSEALSQRRKEIGESQVELAEKLDTTQSLVSRWENGTDTPRSMMFIRLMKALQFDPFGIAMAKR